MDSSSDSEEEITFSKSQPKKRQIKSNAYFSQSQKIKRSISSQIKSSRGFASQPSDFPTTSSKGRNRSLLNESDGAALSQKLENEQLNTYVNNVVGYLLGIIKSKYGIKRSNITDHALDGCSSKHYNTIIKMVKELLKNIFGFDLIQVEKTYYLVNLVKNDLPHLEYTKEESSQTTLLLLILSAIFMTGDSLEEEKLFMFLKDLQIITNDNSKHPYFGNVEGLITETFVKQGYIERLLIDPTSDPKYEYKIGPRTLFEITPRRLMQFTSKVYGNIPIEKWFLQYKAALAAEEDINQIVEN